MITVLVLAADFPQDFKIISYDVRMGLADFTRGSSPLHLYLFRQEAKNEKKKKGCLRNFG